MQLPSLGWGGTTRGLGTLIAVMMRYPEVSSVQYDPDAKSISVGLIVRRAIPDETWHLFSDHLSDVLTAYRAITGRQLVLLQLSRLAVGSVTGMELARDINSVSVEEVGMAIEVAREFFEGDLATDPHDLLEEDMIVQEEHIQERLETITRIGAGHLVALRDEGRVVIFNT